MIRLAWFTLATFLLVPTSGRAADPLDFMPSNARVVVVVDNPRKLAETVTGLEAFKQAQTLAPVREVYDSPTARRLLQVLAFAEKELGAKWPNLLDQLAGNGIALALQIGLEPPPALAIARGTDPKQVAKAFDLAVRALNEEYVRQGVKDRVVVEQHTGYSVAHIGTAAHFAQVDGTLLLSNDSDFFKTALSLARAKQELVPPTHKARKDAAKILPKDPRAWAWVNFAELKKTQTAKDFFDSTRLNFLHTVVVGSTIDCLRRSDFVAAGVYQEPTGFRLRVRLPAGRDGLWPELVLHVPPKGSPGSLALLEPPGTIYSQSFHLDFGYLWANRAKLVDEQQRKDFENGEKQLSKIIPGSVKIGEMLEMWGPYHRIVVANHDVRPYKTEPSLKLPAFGYVATSRDPKFGKSLETTLLAAGLVGTLQFGLKMTESEYEGVRLVSYRFPENKPLPDDPEGLRFNFEPCFALVGDEVVLASTVELGKKLITEVKKPRKPGSPAVWQAKAFAAGGADTLAALSDPLITDAVLGRGIGLADARKEIADIVAWVRTLGTARVELDVTDTEYRLDVVWMIR